MASAYFFCGRSDCRANNNLYCMALVERSPVTGEKICPAKCPFYLNDEQYEEDKKKTVERLIAHDRKDLVYRYYGVGELT